MNGKLLIVFGGIIGGLWETFKYVVADTDWIISVVVGAALSTIASIILNEIYRGIKRLLKKDKYLKK